MGMRMRLRPHDHLSGRPVPPERVKYLADFFGHLERQWAAASSAGDVERLNVAYRRLGGLTDTSHEIVPCLRELADILAGGTFVHMTEMTMPPVVDREAGALAVMTFTECPVEGCALCVAKVPRYMIAAENQP